MSIGSTPLLNPAHTEHPVTTGDPCASDAGIAGTLERTRTEVLPPSFPLTPMSTRLPAAQTRRPTRCRRPRRGRAGPDPGRPHEASQDVQHIGCARPPG